MKISSIDTIVNKVIADKQNANSSESFSSELGEEFAQLIEQFFSGSNVNDNLEMLDQIEKTTIIQGLEKEKVKTEKKVETSATAPEKNTDDEETKLEVDEDQDRDDSSNEEKSIKSVDDSEKKDIQVVSLASNIKNEELKVEDAGLEEMKVTEEQIGNSQQKQSKDHQDSSDQEVEINQNNYLQNNKLQASAKTQKNNTASNEQALVTPNNTVVEQGLKDAAVKNIKKTSTQEDREVQENNMSESHDQNNEESFKASLIKQNSLAAVSTKNSAQDLSSQLVRAANLSELAGQKNAIKTNSSQGNLDLAGVHSNEGIDKSTLAKVKQTASSILAKYSEKTLEKVKELLAKAAQNRDGNSLTLKLNPKELGEITVKVTHRDNNIYARITPDSSEVESMLRHKAAELTQVLIQAGIKSEQLHISIGQERTEAESFKFADFLNGHQNSRQNESFSDKSKQEATENPLIKNAFNNQAKNSNIDLGWIA